MPHRPDVGPVLRWLGRHGCRGLAADIGPGGALIDPPPDEGYLRIGQRVLVEGHPVLAVEAEQAPHEDAVLAVAGGDRRTAHAAAEYARFPVEPQLAARLLRAVALVALRLEDRLDVGCKVDRGSRGRGRRHTPLLSGGEAHRRRDGRADARGDQDGREQRRLMGHGALRRSAAHLSGERSDQALGVGRWAVGGGRWRSDGRRVRGRRAQRPGTRRRNRGVRVIDLAPDVRSGAVGRGVLPYESSGASRLPRRKSLSNMKRTSSNLLVPSRRDFLRVAGLAGVAAAAGLPSWRTPGLRAAPPVFEEIPPSVSGITWVHENAMSPERYLPETMGPGVAFLDYDNDGWMDLFMVNSGGPVDFYTPKAPLQERPLQEQSRRHVHRRHGEGRPCRRQGIRDGLRRRRFRQRRLPRSARDGLRQVHALQEQRQRHVHGCDRAIQPGRRAELDDERRVVRLRQRRQARPVPLQLRGVLAQEQHLLRRQQARAAVLLHSARLQAHAERAVPQQRRRHVHRGQPRHRHPEVAGQGARRRRDRHQRRRSHRSVRRERHGAELPVREPRQGAVGGDRAVGGSGVQRQRHTPLRYGRRRDRPRHGRQAGPVRGERRPGDVLALQERRERVLLGRRVVSRRRAGHAPAERLGPEVLRLRQRRLAST